MAELLLQEKRTLDGALADLRDQYEKRPTGDLARMVQQLEAEIAIRKNPARSTKAERG